MTETSGKGTSRRGFLKAGFAAGGALVAGATAARAAGPDPLITQVQPWNSELGDGVDVHPYGMPVKYEIGRDPAQRALAHR